MPSVKRGIRDTGSQKVGSQRGPKSLPQLERKGSQRRDDIGIGLSNEAPKTKPRGYDLENVNDKEEINGLLSLKFWKKLACRPVEEPKLSKKTARKIPTGRNKEDTLVHRMKQEGETTGCPGKWGASESPPLDTRAVYSHPLPTVYQRAVPESSEYPRT